MLVVHLILQDLMGWKMMSSILQKVRKTSHPILLLRKYGNIVKALLSCYSLKIVV
jgi:hypothetical protein